MIGQSTFEEPTLTLFSLCRQDHSLLRMDLVREVPNSVAFPGISEGIVLLKRPEGKWTKAFCFLVMSTVFFTKKTFNPVSHCAPRPAVSINLPITLAMFLDQEESKVPAGFDQHGCLRAAGGHRCDQDPKFAHPAHDHPNG